MMADDWQPPRSMFILLLLPTATSGLVLPSWSRGTVVGPKVSGHATAVDGGGRILSFGGLTGSAGSPTTDELWAYEDLTWRQLQFDGGPGPRMYAAAGTLDTALYVIGGWDPGAPGSGGTFKDEVWRLDLDTSSWTLMPEPLPCGAVSRHTVCTVGGRVIVHTFRGTVVIDADGAVREQPTTGEAPDGLSMCAAAPLGDASMLIFGGSTKTQGFSADAFVLDTRTWAWRKLRPVGGGAAPTARGSACAAAVEGTMSCIVFGGAGVGASGYDGGRGLVASDETWRLRVDGDEAQWELLEPAVAPAARVAASLSALPEGGFLLHGGWDPSTKETFGASCRLEL